MSTNNLRLVCDEIDREQALRSALRIAWEERDAALTVRDKAAATVEAAKQHMAGVDSELRQYDDLDEKIAAHHASRIAESLEAGGGVPDLDTPELRELIIKRGEASNRRNAFVHATTRLEASLDEANQTLRARQADVDRAALAVVGQIVDMRALDLAARENECASLRRQLLGACVVRPPGSQIPLAAATLKLLRDDSAPALVSKNDTSMGAMWNGLFTRLSRGDSEATLE